MNIQKIKIADLRPARYNPRKDLKPEDKEYQKIKRSIEEFGYVDPIIVNSDMTVIGGHQRIKVLQELGYDEIECVIVNLDKEHEKALNVALNKINGEWDMEKLKDILEELDTGVFDMDLTGFDYDELEKLLGQTHEPDIDEDHFDTDAAAEQIIEPITQKGDIWQLGRHTLICGDSTDPVVIARLMHGRQAKLIITDPPYNVNYGEKAKMLDKYEKGHRNIDAIKNDNLPEKEFHDFLFKAFKCMFDVAGPGCPVYVFHADTERINFQTAYEEAGFKLAQCLIWVKNSLVLSRQDYHWRHEPILYGWKEGAAHYWYGERDKDSVFEDKIDIDKLTKEEMAELLKELLRDRENTTVLHEDKPISNELHPTMKPLKLIGRLMCNSSAPGDLVLDPFGGSGSTLMAAEQLGRVCLMSETDSIYCDVIVQR